MDNPNGMNLDDVDMNLDDVGVGYTIHMSGSYVLGDVIGVVSDSVTPHCSSGEASATLRCEPAPRCETHRRSQHVEHVLVRLTGGVPWLNLLTQD